MCLKIAYDEVKTNELQSAQDKITSNGLILNRTLLICRFAAFQLFGVKLLKLWCQTFKSLKLFYILVRCLKKITLFHGIFFVLFKKKKKTYFFIVLNSVSGDFLKD